MFSEILAALRRISDNIQDKLFYVGVTFQKTLLFGEYRISNPSTIFSIVVCLAPNTHLKVGGDGENKF